MFLQALKRWLSRNRANDALSPGDVGDAFKETGRIVQSTYAYGMRPTLRLYLNRGERYPDPVDVHMTQEGWHYTARYSRLPAPSRASLQRQDPVVRRAAERAGWR